MVDILERLQSPQTSLGTLWPEPNLHEEAAEKIIQLREELAAVTERMSKLDFERTAAELERDALREETARLREALKPFSKNYWSDDWHDGSDCEINVQLRDIRRAASLVDGYVWTPDDSSLREENARLAALSAKLLAKLSQLREALKPFAEMELWTDTYPDGPIEATGKKRFVDPLWIVAARAARAAIREGGKDD